MALDFLSASATSTDVERLFSHSGLVVTKGRYNLTANYIHQSTVLGNWLGVDDLIPVKAICGKLNVKYEKKKELSDSEWSDSDEKSMDGTMVINLVNANDKDSN
ncbi:hypothetical protein GYMLUDRAFT_251947 [Collybiopsis luxurians FD-317 M1]|uniref:HAT C-terminal dimerisation domain-containing protein n=1 Tax=Collybiopsis luxurians FD-317 M1 TaxID=944289 RepID=A0A0D0BPP9_9AGAR|nr:hypothetical protein GYMLUDRAFT_251947 [Collybiopsis luxurians FD-317 M1]